MKKLLTVLVVGSALALGACKTTEVIKSFLDKATTAVIAGTQDLCGFVPEAQGILALLQALGVKTDTQVPAVVTRVCNAANAVAPAAPAARFGIMSVPSSPVKVKVNGVTITGRFI